MKSIASVLSKLKVGDKVSDGVRTWSVVNSVHNGDENVIAVPYKWKSKTMGDRFELWDDAQSQVSSIKNLKKV